MLYEDSGMTEEVQESLGGFRVGLEGNHGRLITESVRLCNHSSATYVTRGAYRLLPLFFFGMYHRAPTISQVSLGQHNAGRS